MDGLSRDRIGSRYGGGKTCALDGKAATATTSTCPPACAAMVRSPHAHALIRAIDIAARVRCRRPRVLTARCDGDG